MLTGFFHLLNAVTTVFILLFIGQLTSDGDSTKSKILKVIFFDSIAPNSEWVWLISLLFIKIISSYAKAKSITITQHHIQKSLQVFCLRNLKMISQPDSIGREIKNLSRAIIKGRVIVIADFIMLSLIFCLLTYLNMNVALAWLAFFIVGILIRMMMAQHYGNAKKNFRKVQTKWMRKFVFLLKNSWLLTLDRQLEKEQNIFQRRTDLAFQSTQKFSIQKAWTAAFLPAYFYSFLLSIVYFSDIFQVEKTNSLQLILVLIYSQSALVRSFKSPEYWKQYSSIVGKWKPLKSYSSDENQPIKLLYQSISDHVDNNTTIDTKLWSEVISLKKNPTQFEIQELENISNSVSIFISSQPCNNESFLASIICTKENRGLELINDAIEQLELTSEWTNFNWKASPAIKIVNQKQLNWLNMFRSIMH
ncbi:MAG: hypothetical protein RL362_1314, partial [Bacteroidota bacterium]